MSPTHTIAHLVARSKVLYFLYPSLKFLSSHNSPRNFFSPSRGESKMFRLTKLKISTIFLNKSNFLNRKRLCFFASKSALLDLTPLSISLPRREELCLASKSVMDFASSYLCVFTSKSRLAASLPSCLAASDTDLASAHLCLSNKRPPRLLQAKRLPPPRRQVLAQIQYFSALLLASCINFIIFFRVFQYTHKKSPIFFIEDFL